jgi:hypothetical protein
MFGGRSNLLSFRCELELCENLLGLLRQWRLVCSKVYDTGSKHGHNKKDYLGSYISFSIIHSIGARYSRIYISINDHHFVKHLAFIPVVP